MWLNRITIEKLANGKFALRLSRRRKTKDTKNISGIQHQAMTKSLGWVNLFEGEEVKPFIICKEVRSWERSQE